ncbi:MAG: hypothetical protein JKY95_15360 [Planctomycetaceae bacterium]|nr:hypothetical protein [Planctomycetaceae bacterium]
MVKHNKTEMAWDMDPTLIVYVTDRLDLTKIQIPDGVEIEEIADLRARFETALRTGNEPTKSRAQRLLERLDNDVERVKLEASEYNSQVKQIHKFVQHVRTRAK